MLGGEIQPETPLPPHIEQLRLEAQQRASSHAGDHDTTPSSPLGSPSVSFAQDLTRRTQASDSIMESPQRRPLPAYRPRGASRGRSVSYEDVDDDREEGEPCCDDEDAEEEEEAEAAYRGEEDLHGEVIRIAVREGSAVPSSGPRSAPRSGATTHSSRRSRSVSGQRSQFSSLDSTVRLVWCLLLNGLCLLWLSTTGLRILYPQAETIVAEETMSCNGGRWCI